VPDKSGIKEVPTGSGVYSYENDGWVWSHGKQTINQGINQGINHHTTFIYLSSSEYLEIPECELGIATSTYIASKLLPAPVSPEKFQYENMSAERKNFPGYFSRPLFPGKNMSSERNFSGGIFMPRYNKETYQKRSPLHILYLI
jgi:hypothetical protein